MNVNKDLSIQKSLVVVLIVVAGDTNLKQTIRVFSVLGLEHLVRDSRSKCYFVDDHH